MSPEIFQAFESAVKPNSRGRMKTERQIRAEVFHIVKLVELVIEMMPDQTMTLLELHNEIAGQA